MNLEMIAFKSRLIAAIADVDTREVQRMVEDGKERGLINTGQENETSRRGLHLYNLPGKEAREYACEFILWVQENI